ncbi:MAG: biotin--[acetyl-CoA-carboxylase] ligase [Spirochaetales bacterium]|nr:biotin--[acetyl-CoA-carboxylase] ligase [Spirochaetales bacterium]
MVNKSGIRHRSQLLNILRTQNQPLSGDLLGQQLGVSRVTIHKHIAALKNEGYSIEVGRHGYVLQESGLPRLASWEFPPEENIRVLKVVDSTMNEAMALADRHPGEECIVVAERQTLGRGLGNQDWHSPEGGLWASRVLYPHRSSAEVQRMVLAASVALVHVLEKDWNLQAKISWPNDVMVDGRKIAGLMADALIRGDRIARLVMGMGIHVNNNHSDMFLALKDAVGKEADRRSLLLRWREETDSILSSDPPPAGDSSPTWCHGKILGIGEERSLHCSKTLYTGYHRGIDGLGRLLLEIAPGKILGFSPGDLDEYTRSRV